MKCFGLFYSNLSCLSSINAKENKVFPVFFWSNALGYLRISVSSLAIVSSFLFDDVLKLAVFDTFLEIFLVLHLKLFLGKRFGLVYLEIFAEKNQKILKKLEERKS